MVLHTPGSLLAEGDVLNIGGQGFFAVPVDSFSCWIPRHGRRVATVVSDSALQCISPPINGFVISVHLEVQLMNETVLFSGRLAVRECAVVASSWAHCILHVL